MKMQFYVNTLPRCSCGKPASAVIMGTGNVEYHKSCDDCLDSKLTTLRSYWNSRGEEENRNQIEAMRHDR